MIDWLALYQLPVEPKLSSVDWLASLQSQAWDWLKKYGLPNKHQEEWRYLAMGELTHQPFAMRKNTAINYQPKEGFAPLDFPAYEVYIYNGQLIDINFPNRLPKGVIICCLEEALTNYPEYLKDALGQLINQQHGFQALNTALVNQGCFIYIPEKINLESPIVIRHYQDNDHNAAFLRHIIIAAPASQAEIIEEYNGSINQRYFTNAISEIYADNHSKITHYRMQNESNNAFHISETAIAQQSMSDFTSHVFNIGGKLAKTDLTVKLQKPKAHCYLNGVYLSDNQQQVDNHTTVYHEVESCDSTQDYKGILQGKSKSVFNGKVVVLANAQKTQAKQNNRNLLLSKQAEINTKPQLEIFADDVVCTHGATVGQLDEQALFFLTTRGLPREIALNLLKQAFIKNNLTPISNAKIKAWISKRLEQALGNMNDSF